MNESDWLPIETAPKDGTEIFVGQQGTGDVEIVRWNESEWVDRLGDNWLTPTHWVPLLMPPAID